MAVNITEPQARKIVEDSVILLNEFEKYLNENTFATQNIAHSNLDFVSHADQLLVSAREVADWASDEKHAELEAGIHAAVASFRTGLAGVKAQAAAFLAPSLRILGRYYGFSDTDPETIIDKISRYYIDNGIRIQSRGILVAAASPGRVGGDDNTTNAGTVFTASTDENGDPVDNLWPETIEFRCIQDEHSGATEHRELFEVRGEPSHTDGLSIGGSGAITTTTAITGNNSLVLNPSFTSYSGAVTAPTITNWTNASGGTALIDMDTSVYYRDSMAEAAPAALKFVGNETITQTFALRNLTLRTDHPYFVHLAYKVGSGATGNLSFKIGGQSKRTIAFNHSGGTGWKVHTEKFWFNQINEEDPDFEIQVSSLSGGTIHVDEFIVAPYSEFNGLYYAIVGGTAPFLIDDRFTVAVTQPAGIKGLVNEWLWKAYNKYIPCEASPTGPADWIDRTDYL